MMSKLEIDVAGYKRLDKNKEAVSKGYQSKFANGKIWVKLDKEDNNESLAEEFSSKLLEASNLDKLEYVRYQQCEVYNGDTYLGSGCVSDNFIKEGEMIITFQKIFEIKGFDSSDMHVSIHEYDNIIYEVKKQIMEFTKLDITEYLKKIITLDSITLNPDRHYNNLALIYNTKTKKYKPAPIFDNGMGFLMSRHQYKDKPLDYQIDRTFSKPFYHNFESQYKLTGCPGIIFDKKQVIELIKIYNNDKITRVMEHSLKKYPEAFATKSIIGF